MNETYYFSVVRFLPHPLRGERMNLGVVLVAEDGSYGDFRFSSSYREKLRVLGPDIHVNAVTGWVEDFTTRFSTSAVDTSSADELTATTATLESLASIRGGQVEFTEPSPILVEGDAHQALISLYKDYVGPLHRGVSALVGRPQVRQRIKRAFREWKIPERDLVPEPELPGKRAPNKMDLGILGTNGSTGTVVVAIEPISFRIASAADIIRQRDHVAWVSSDLPDGPKPSICAVVTSPTPSHRDLFESSRSLFRELDVEVVEEDGMDTLRAVLVRRGVLQEPPLQS